MQESEQTARLRLLEAARKEFLKNGYEKASLRKISADAGVTTGAVYFFFHNKEDLFDQVVGQTLTQLELLGREMVQDELENPAVGVDNERRLLEFCWKKKETLQILLQKAGGTKYEGLWREIQGQLEANFARFFRKYGAGQADEALIRILVRMKLQGYMELIMGDFSLERTLELAQMVGWYTEGGFEALMEKFRQRM